MTLKDKLIKICKENATLYGFASVEDYQDYMTDELKGYPNAIAIGMKIPDKIIDNIKSGRGELDYQDTYNRLNKKLDDTTNKLENIIKKEGYQAKSVNASYIIPDGKLYGELSHKMIANLAGLGWIGKSCLLITPEYGPRLRWATLLTDYDLETENNPLNSRCNDCRLCVQKCPSHALNDVEFRKEDPRSVRYDAFKCSRYFDKLESMNRPRLCGLCVKVCPWGKKSN